MCNTVSAAGEEDVYLDFTEGSANCWSGGSFNLDSAEASAVSEETDGLLEEGKVDKADE